MAGSPTAGPQGPGSHHPGAGTPMAGQNRIRQHVNGNGQPGLLEQLGRNLTDAARSGEIDPVIGRDKEVERVIEILNRRNKNNPVLIGEPGVGKTAVVEGLAVRIADGKVPAKLKNREIFVLDVASLVADTGIRGQFEERMQQLIAELQSREDVILFIDELHLLVGAGSAQGSMDAGNILKPALARGDIQVVGATTLKEYRQIEKDAALERRFQPVMVEEPSVEDTVVILEGLVSRYEDFHQVQYTPGAIRACAELSHRYLRDRRLPDKAIDLMDEAGSKANLRQGANPDSIAARLEQIAAEKTEATKVEDYERAARLRDEEQALLAMGIKAEHTKDHTPAVDGKTLDTADGINSDAVSGAATAPATREVVTEVVTVEDIRRIVEDKTGIPVTKLQADEQQRLKDLERHLRARVIGQDTAVRQVAKAVRRSRAGLKPKHRPIGSFLFFGPTGVGKTELARALAKELFGTEDAMIRLDMSEYMERHSVSKIIGSPPGYVGHEEAGQLTEQIRRHPYSLVLLDEIEKAHPDVLNVLLQILEDGRLTDSQGRTVHFEDSVIIMTSNAGITDKKITLGFQADGDVKAQQDVISDLTGHFKPEFLNRLDSIIRFENLAEEDLEQIVRLMLDELTHQLAGNNVMMEYDDTVVQWLAVHGRDPRFGARPLRRLIQQTIEDPVADFMLDEAVAGASIQLHVTINSDSPMISRV
ncbi:ATP-dependent Clp protease ATP-binding subunit [Alicyclobacillus curvatus]|nr:ATP-dependent Clp protease ATP-binding subunit [Alicyclobacillus curvatus]